MGKSASVESANLAVFVTPKSSRDVVEGFEEFEGVRELKVRVRAIPDEGKANKAVCAVVAKMLGVPKSAVSVAGGSTSRHKRLVVVGLSQEDLESRLEVLE